MPVLLVAALVTLVPWANASPDNPGADEAAFVTRTNAERTSRGLASLGVFGDLQTVARRHAAEMARRNTLGHYGDLRTEVSNWNEVGENVGVGPDVDSIHRAFMASSTHRGEILRASYRDLGVGVVWANGRLWVSEVFRAPANASAAPAPAPASAPPRQLAQRASRSAPRTAIPAAMTHPAPLPPPPPAPEPVVAPTPAPAPTTTVPPTDAREEAQVLNRHLTDPATLDLALAAPRRAAEVRVPASGVVAITGVLALVAMAADRRRRQRRRLPRIR